MSRNVTAVTRQSVQASETGACFLWLLDIEDSTIPQIITETMRVVDNNVAITSNSEIYHPVAFQFSPPAQEDGEISNSSLTIANVDRSLIEAIRQITAPLKVTASFIRSDSPDVVEEGPYIFYLRNVSYTINAIKGELTYLTYLNDNISTVKFTTTLFPGLFG